MIVSVSLLAAAGIQILCQLFKVVFYSIRERRLRLGWFFSAGGMPSAHSAFVTALTVSLGLSRGLASESFSIAFVFSTIIIYDIIRVRGAVAANTRVLAALLEKLAPAEGLSLAQQVGHTLGEVLIGVAVGAAAAAGLHLLL